MASKAGMIYEVRNSGRKTSLTDEKIDIAQVLVEAKNRWLKPIEICNVLLHYQEYDFQLNNEPPVKPPSGSLYLFDRKVVRYFRKDGHSWRKKKDGKTVREAHEKLKAGSVDILHCYYAHSDEDDRFQRRCYWLLEGANENIVLVHYREVPEGSGRVSISPKGLNFTDGKSPSHYDDFGYNVDLISPNHGQTSYTDPASENPSPSFYHPIFNSRESMQDPMKSEKDTSPIIEYKPSPLLTSSSSQLPVTSSLSPLQPKSFTFEQGSDSAHLPLLQSDAGLKLLERIRFLRSQGSLGDPLQQLDDAQLLHWVIHKLRQNEPQAQTILNLDQMDPSDPHHMVLSQPELQAKSSPTAMDEANQQEFGGASGLRDVKLESQSQYMDQSPDISVNSEWQQNQPEKQQHILPDNLEGKIPINEMEVSSHAYDFDEFLGNADADIPTLSISQWNPMSLNAPNLSIDAVLETPKLFPNTEPINWKQYANYCSSATSTSQNLPIVSDPKPEMLETFYAVSPIDSTSFVNSIMTNDVESDSTFPSISSFPSFPSSSSLSASRLLKEMLEEAENSISINASLKDRMMKKDYSLSSYSNLHMWERDMSLDGEKTEKEKQGIGKQNQVANRYGAGSDQTTNPGLDLPQIIGSEQLDSDLNPLIIPPFFIIDISRNCSSTTGGCKILAIGRQREGFSPHLQGESWDGKARRWGCLFGEIEVEAEEISPCVLRCTTPPHPQGTVPFTITGRDRIPFSQTILFHFISISTSEPPSDLPFQPSPAHIIPLQVRLVRLLLKTNQELAEDSVIKSAEAEEWAWLEKEDTPLGLDQAYDQYSFVIDNLLQIMLKRNLSLWLHCKKSFPAQWDEKGLAMIHLTSACGYGWAISLLVQSGVDANLRDHRGRTALHWASAFGREEVVVSLLAEGANPSMLATSSGDYTGGFTPADLAMSAGHSGIAAFLAENILNFKIKDMSLMENNPALLMETLETAAEAGEAAAQSLADSLSLSHLHMDAPSQEIETSLMALRSVTESAVLLQAASKDRPEGTKPAGLEIDGKFLTENELLQLGAAKKIQRAYRSVRNERKVRHRAAIQIQRRYRGWKVRKNYLRIRERIVKLQANVKGYLQRKRYQKLRWSIMVLQMAVLRWRRKRSGLSYVDRLSITKPDPFTESLPKSSPESQLSDMGQSPHSMIDSAITMVRSMSRSDSGRSQYSRMQLASQALKGKDDQFHVI